MHKFLEKHEIDGDKVDYELDKLLEALGKGRKQSTVNVRFDERLHERNLSELENERKLEQKYHTASSIRVRKDYANDNSIGRVHHTKLKGWDTAHIRDEILIDEHSDYLRNFIRKTRSITNYND